MIPSMRNIFESRCLALTKSSLQSSRARARSLAAFVSGAGTATSTTSHTASVLN